MSKKQEVAVQESSLPAANYDYGSDFGSGMENADAASFAIPFLSVVQKMSPICDEGSGSYNPDAKPGMLVNTVTGELIDGKAGIILFPAHYQRRFLRWAAKDSSGGGFKGEVLPEVAAQMEHSGQVVNVDGRLYFPLDDGSVNEKKCDRLADVRNHFCVLEGGQQVLLSLGSTQIKKSKALMSLLSAVRVKLPDGRSVVPPTWANRVLMQTVLEQNDQGSWYGVKFSLAGMISPDSDDYAAGKAFHAALMQGTAGEVRYAEQEPQGKSDAF